MDTLNYQNDVRLWMAECFGIDTLGDIPNRNARFTEEALELVQSLGFSKEDVLTLVDYVYSRPEGEPSQEMGGVMVTLAGLANAASLYIDDCATDELRRVQRPENLLKIRGKHQDKPKASPLPQ